MTLLRIRYFAAALGISLTIAGLVMDNHAMIWVAIGSLSVAVVLGMILRQRKEPSESR